MKYLSEFLTMLRESYTMYHAIDEAKNFLKTNHFKEINYEDDIEADGKYFIRAFDSSIIAFTIGQTNQKFRIIGSHSDSPSIKIKPQPTVNKHDVMTLNTEIYGGLILNTWFDRDLSVAGRLYLKSDDPWTPVVKKVHTKDRATLSIPNIAIHMNREVNKGIEINPQKHTLPIMLSSKYETFETFVADQWHVNPDEILDFDLYLYDTNLPKLVGAQEEFISAGKLDNLGMAFPSLYSLVENTSDDINIVYIADSEEIGSATKSGAGTVNLKNTLEWIANQLGLNFLSTMKNSFMISADQTHAFHPNYADKNDITNFPIINRGPSIKKAANGAYTTDGFTSSVLKEIAGDIPVQEFVNRSDMRGGSTIGPIITKNLSLNSIDLGNPILGMHSIRELGGVKDFEFVIQLFDRFFSI